MAATGTAAGEATKEQMQTIQNYIKKSGHTLMRSNARLAAAAVDPKFHPTTDGRWLVYVPSNEDTDRIATSLNTQMSAADFSKLELRRLPDDARAIQGHGLLYLPNPYVVPGGRFNEMYGWDSYFIVRGLVRDGDLAMARNMIENFFFEIEHYGAVLNANRTYYFTRSQPPFLTSMIMSYYDAQKAAGKQDREW